MSVQPNDLKVFRAEANNDSSSNGGRMSTTEAVNGGSDVWPPVPAAERESGSVKYRKTFHANRNAADEVLTDVRLAVWAPTPADDALMFCAATHTDTQGELTGSEPLYGAAYLHMNAEQGQAVLLVRVEDPASTLFRNGDLVLITDRDDPQGLAGNIEWHRISGSPSVSGDVITIPLATPLAHDYSTMNTNVSSVLERAELAAAVTDLTVTSAAGTFDGDLLAAHNVGSIYDTITLTFTSATVFTAVGTALGSLGTGNRGSVFAPTNPATGTPYCTVDPASWGGTWAPGDTVSFTTVPGAIPVFERRVVPPGAQPGASGRAILLWGETG